MSVNSPSTIWFYKKTKKDIAYNVSLQNSIFYDRVLL
jgi:hypothetical protein